MRDAIASHQQRRAQRGQSQTTLELCHFSLNRFSDYCDRKGLVLERLTGQDLKEYQDYLSWEAQSKDARFLAPATIDLHLRFVRAFLRECRPDFQEHLLLGRPQVRARSLLSRRQLDEALNRPDPRQPMGMRDRALLRIMAELGLFGEACAAFQVGDFSRPGAQLKGHPLSPLLHETLLRYLDQGRPKQTRNPDETALFLTKTGTRMTPVNAGLIARRHSEGLACPRDLHRSWLAHRQAFLEQRLRGL